MRILFIAHYFQPEPNFFFGLPFAKELADRGHEVEVLTGLPNYPGGKIYDGYKVRPIQRETMDGIEIIRAPLYPSHDQSSLKRVLCYSSLALTASAIAPFSVKSADVAYVSQGPATIGLPACVLRTLRRIPFVYHIQDLWPDSLLSTGMFNSKVGLKVIHAWCNHVYKRAAKIAVITPGMKEVLCQRGVPEEKIEIIYNWCDDARVVTHTPKPHLRDKLKMTGRFNIVFAGNLGKAQALDAVLKAARILQAQSPQVQFVFFGGGVEYEPLQRMAQEMGLNNVLFQGWRPVSEIGMILQLADVLLVHLKDDPLFSITIPSKTQAYLAVGRPVLVGVKGDAANLVTQANAGLACEPENPESIAAAVKRFVDMPREKLDAMGANGKAFYREQLSFKVGSTRFEKLFEKVVSG